MTAERDWLTFSVGMIVEETTAMRDALREGARYLASMEPQPVGARMMAVKMLKVSKGCGLASAYREYRAIRAEERRKLVALVR